MIPRVDVLNGYLETSIAGIKALTAEYPQENHLYWDDLNYFFQAVINGEKVRSFYDHLYE
jgi:hypothetical protein